DEGRLVTGRAELEGLVETYVGAREVEVSAVEGTLDPCTTSSSEVHGRERHRHVRSHRQTTPPVLHPVLRGRRRQIDLGDVDRPRLDDGRSTDRGGDLPGWGVPIGGSLASDRRSLDGDFGPQEER